MSHCRTLRRCALFTSLAGVVTACGAEDPGGSNGDTLATAATPAPGAAAPTSFGDGAIQELAFPGRTGEIRTGKFQTPDGVQELTYESIDGKAVYQGDMILTDEDDPDYRSGGVASVGARWPYGLVPFAAWGLYLDPRVQAAIDYIKRNTTIRFMATNSTTIKRLRFVSSTDPNVCSSPVGKGSGTGTQDILLGSNCSTGNVIHEISHSLGMYHEQSRSDRDTYITMIPSCIDPTKTHNFDKFGSAGINIGTYDYSSIMHYDSNFFVDPAKPTCQYSFTLPSGSPLFANRSAYTGTDIMGVNSLYLPWMHQIGVDWDRDGVADLAVWRPSNHTFYIRQSGHSNSTRSKSYGESTDIPVLGDWDGDGVTDYAVFRPRTGQWFYTFSNSGVQSSNYWGGQGDVPVPGDYDGDGYTEPAVFRPDEGNWYLWAYNMAWQFGQAGDIPVQGDWDADGITDVATWRPSNGVWSISPGSGAPAIVQQWGAPGDIPVPGDYDGDGYLDMAVWRPGGNNLYAYWYILPSSTGYDTNTAWSTQWGLYDDTPAPADYDGDGVTDLAVYRPSEHNWYIANQGVISFGANGDAPIP
jgi:hypothetical protein